MGIALRPFWVLIDTKLLSSEEDRDGRYLDNGGYLHASLRSTVRLDWKPDGQKKSHIFATIKVGMGVQVGCLGAMLIGWVMINQVLRVPRPAAVKIREVLASNLPARATLRDRSD